MNQKPEMVRWLHTSLYSQLVSKLYNNYCNHIWTKQTNTNAKLKGDGVIFWLKKKKNVSWKKCGGALLDTAQLGTVTCYCGAGMERLCRFYNLNILSTCMSFFEDARLQYIFV